MFGKIVRSLMVVAACSLQIGCSPITYDQAHDAKFDFAALGTYAIATDWSGKSVVRIHPDAVTRINKVIEQELQRLGHVRSYPGTPDFVITYRLEADWDPRLSEAEKRQRLGFSGSHFPDADPRGRNYQTLSFVIEMSSPKEKKWIWRGAAGGVRYAPGDSPIGLADVASKLMESFPPK